MNDSLNKYLQQAIDLKNEEKNQEAVKLLKTAEHKFGESPKITGLITMILYYNLQKINESLDYALKWTSISPMSEKASITLVHILFELKRHADLESEISRFAKTGVELDHYNTLLEENGLSKKDFS